MKSIILASNSPQRRMLLKRCGIKFIVCPSNIREIARLTTTCAALVKQNALFKAQDVASQFKEGLVIGADTLVYDGRHRLIGKPKSLKHAKKILKQLFSRPHWVYTGIAIIDASTGRQTADYEKTKVIMNPLSDAEIDRYHRRVSPLDKAGGFDIEGHGGLFIRRIEGCYANVIGLPMAKLREMLKEFGVFLF